VRSTHRHDGVKPVITCPSCRKQNQDHYKFCLGCGAELPRPGAASAPSLDETAPLGVPMAKPDTRPDQIGLGPVQAPAVAAPIAKPSVIEDETTINGFSSTGTRACPKCGQANPPSNRFCATCGSRIDDGPPKVSGAQPTKIAEGLEPSGFVLTALNPDGTESGTYPLPRGTTPVGRDTGGIFASDSYMSRKHASFSPTRDGVVVRDEGSLNGVFLRLPAEQRRPVAPGQIFRIGQELIEYEELAPEGPDPDGVEAMGSPIKGYVGRIAMVLGRQSRGSAFPVPETGLSLGRERGEVLFSDDGYVSGLHCRLNYEDGQLYLTDLGSSNGTFIRVAGEEKVGDGDILLMGQQLFRVNL
jgi:pSer/pThr/pTyr-binding forkhead associated (FHA) protein